MKAYEVNGKGIFVPLVDKWDWVSTINRLKDRYDVLFLKGEEYAFIIYGSNIDMGEVFIMLHMLENGKLTNVKEIEV